MGLLDLVKRKSPVEKAQKALCEPYSQPEYRREAMQKLLEIGTEEAHAALLKRFTFVANGHIADEEEKSDLVEELVKIGQPALPPIQRFIQSEKHLAFPIRAFARIAPRERVAAFLLEALCRYEPLDHRSTQAKTLLVMGIADHGGPEQAPALAAYLKDHHDDVQFQVIVALEKFKNPETRAALAEVCVGDGHSGRIQGRAAQALLELGWPVKEQWERMNPEIRAAYLLGKKGNLVKKGQPDPAEADGKK